MNIIISGYAGEGKSTVALACVRMLKKAGFNVKLSDDVDFQDYLDNDTVLASVAKSNKSDIIIDVVQTRRV